MKTTLGEICEIQLGKMLSPKAHAGGKRSPYLRNQNVQWGRFKLDDIAEMDFDERERCKFSLKPGDLLVCEGGEPGRAAIWEGQIQECFYQKALHRLRPQADKATPDFLLYRLWLGGIRKEFTSSQGQTTIAHLPAERLSTIPVELPDLPTQRRLATRLKSQMAAVEEARRRVEEQVQALDELVSTWIREGIQHPETTVKPVEEVMEEVTQGVGSRWANFPVLGATRSGAAPAKDKVGKAPGRYKPVFPGSVFYNPMRIMIGSIAMLDEGDAPGITSPDYVVVRPRGDALHHLWAYEWLRSTHGARFIQTLARGGVRERMLYNRLKSGEMPVPPRAWQDRFAEVSRLRRQSTAALVTQLEALDKLPGAFLREAFGSL